MTHLATAPDTLLADTLKKDLAAAFQLAARFGWHESVGNHFSAAVSEDGRHFLMNPKWRHFSTITPDCLQLLDANDTNALDRPDAPDATAWQIHGAIHRHIPSARVVFHCHPKYTTALASLKDPSLLPIDQNTARFFEQYSIDTNFSGMADTKAEGNRLAQSLGNRSILLMGNHGITVAAQTVAEAFEDLYYFERAAETLMTAYASGQELNVMPNPLARKTAEDWIPYKGMAQAHFEHLKASLDLPS